MSVSYGLRAVSVCLTVFTALAALAASEASAREAKAKLVSAFNRTTDSSLTRIQRTGAFAGSKPTATVSIPSQNCIERPGKQRSCNESSTDILGKQESCSECGSGQNSQLVAQPNQNFSYELASPQEHFDMWLKMNLYPSLCHTVLCRRQCALNGYESCNALGVKRSILKEAAASPEGCGSGGCGAGH